MVSAVSRLVTTSTTSEKGVHCVSSMCHLFIHCPSSRSSIWSCDNSSVVVCLTTRTFSSAFFRLLQSWLLSPQQPTLKTRVLGSFFLYAHCHWSRRRDTDWGSLFVVTFPPSTFPFQSSSILGDPFLLSSFSSSVLLPNSFTVDHISWHLLTL